MRLGDFATYPGPQPGQVSIQGDTLRVAVSHTDPQPPTPSGYSYLSYETLPNSNIYTYVKMPIAPASSQINVAPTIQTSVSPQISPAFVQTGAGSSGSVGAGSTMSAPTSQGSPVSTGTSAEQAAAQAKAAQDLAAQQEKQIAIQQTALDKMLIIMDEQTKAAANQPVGYAGVVNPPAPIPQPAMPVMGAADLVQMANQPPVPVVSPEPTPAPAPVPAIQNLPTDKNTLILAALVVGTLFFMGNKRRSK